jgi:hypothetical protein
MQLSWNHFANLPPAVLRRAVVDWFAARWVVGSMFLAAGAFALIPAVAWPLGVSVTLILLHTPVYMLHQIEEHAGDRFRRYVNARLFPGVDALSVENVLVVNMGVVWGINLAALYAAVAFGAGWGLAAPYMMLVNAATHAAMAIRMRGENPGLITALFLFVPLGAATLLAVPATAIQHVLGLAVAVALHAQLVVVVTRRAQRLQVP